MSFSLTISGHVSDAEQAVKVDEVLRAKGAEVVAAVRELGVDPSSALFSGPSGYVNLLEDPVEPASSTEADLEE